MVRWQLYKGLKKSATNLLSTFSHKLDMKNWSDMENVRLKRTKLIMLITHQNVLCKSVLNINHMVDVLTEIVKSTESHTVCWTSDSFLTEQFQLCQCWNFIFLSRENSSTDMLRRCLWLYLHMWTNNLQMQTLSVASFTFPPQTLHLILIFISFVED